MIPEPMTEVLASITGLRQGYSRREVLSDVSFDLSRGITTLLGINGAGKTTLLRTLIGELQPRAGSVTWAAPVGAETSSSAPTGADLRRRTGYLPQNPNLPNGMRLDDVVAYSAWLKGLPYRRTGQAVRDAVARVGLQDRLGAKIKTLSGGMRQRAALAAAVVHDPAVLILDEPTSGLDPQQRIEVRRFIRDLAEDRTVLVSTHLLPDVVHLDGRVLVLHDGTVCFHGSPAELEAQADGRTPGDTPIEQGFMSLLGQSR